MHMLSLCYFSGKSLPSQDITMAMMWLLRSLFPSAFLMLSSLLQIRFPPSALLMGVSHRDQCRLRNCSFSQWFLSWLQLSLVYFFSAVDATLSFSIFFFFSPCDWAHWGFSCDWAHSSSVFPYSLISDEAMDGPGHTPEADAVLKLTTCPEHASHMLSLWYWSLWLCVFYIFLLFCSMLPNVKMWFWYMVFHWYCS